MYIFVPPTKWVLKQLDNMKFDNRVFYSPWIASTRSRHIVGAWKTFVKFMNGHDLHMKKLKEIKGI